MKREFAKWFVFPQIIPSPSSNGSEDITKVIQMWKKEYLELGAHEKINYVQIFENKGAIMGCSNPHPHGQIWSQSSIPTEILKKSSEIQGILGEKQAKSFIRLPGTGIGSR